MSNDTFDFSEFMDGYIADLSRALNSLSRESVELLYTEMLKVMDNDGKVHFIGNGGSAATPSHSAGDWSKELGLKTIAHTDNIAALTAWANDTSYANIFVGQLQTWLAPDDLVVGYSGSGNSSNVLNGIAFANENGARTVGITGNYKSGNGGALAEMAHVAIVCDTTSMERIEDLQLIINHIVKEAVKASRNMPSHS
ncbi:MAG: SIS domain-containing protein [Candidatus Thalassarchaeaceae archaeon]|jgi:D-sedoheptulose 7-phosphate isomerase|nr:SIS domain-containing protein [Candidatus Thalassarchaeaceae archaeon]